MKTVKEIYNYFKLHTNLYMLSGANFSFWQMYKDNHSDFDRIFARTYANFQYFDPLEDDDQISTVATHFIEDVENYLLINKKRFEEMFRIQGLTDTELPMTYNYDMTEVMDKTNNSESAVTTGQRSDIVNNQTGQQNFSNVNKVTAFNASNENTKDSNTSSAGSRQDINQFTKGQETDTSQGASTENYTLTRKGNIGVHTGADILMGFDKAMPVFDFYSKIFSELCEHLLLIGGDKYEI